MSKARKHKLVYKTSEGTFEIFFRSFKKVFKFIEDNSDHIISFAHFILVAGSFVQKIRVGSILLSIDEIIKFVEKIDKG
jgi:hypothetical protein